MSNTRYFKSLKDAEDHLIKNEGYRISKDPLDPKEKNLFAQYIKDTDKKTITASIHKVFGNEKGDWKITKKSELKPNTGSKTAENG